MSAIQEAPRAYQEGMNIPLPITPSFSPDHGDLSADSARSRSLPAWRRGLIAATAFASGLTAAGGISPSPAEAGGFLLTGSSTNTTVECVNDVILVYKEPPIVAAIGENTDQTTETADADLPQDVEIALGNGIILVNAPACPPEPTPGVELSAEEALDAVLTQKDSDITKRGSQDVKDLNNSLWNGFETELLTFTIPDDPTTSLTKEYISDNFKFLFDKTDEYRVDTAAGTIALVYAIYNWTFEHVPGEKGVELRKSLTEFADGVSDYLIKDLKKSERGAARVELAEKSKGFLEYHLSFSR